jgi:hypothetical protein
MDTYVKGHLEPGRYVVIKITPAPEYYIVAVCGTETDANVAVAALNNN